MLTICRYYCGPFLQWLLFASTGLILLYAAFIFKRGVRQGRVALRKKAFILIYIAVLKFLLMDSGFVADRLFCDNAAGVCDASKIHIFKIGALVALVPAFASIYIMYKKYIDREVLARRSVKGMWIRFWANLSVFIVLGLTFWLVAPWVTYLIYGSVASYFFHSAWKLLVFIAYILILVTFWRYEDCSLSPQSEEDKDFNHQTWIPRDTLWLSLAMLIITHGLLIVSLNFLTGA